MSIFFNGCKSTHYSLKNRLLTRKNESIPEKKLSSKRRTHSDGGLEIQPTKNKLPDTTSREKSKYRATQSAFYYNGKIPQYLLYHQSSYQTKNSVEFRKSRINHRIGQHIMSLSYIGNTIGANLALSDSRK